MNLFQTSTFARQLKKLHKNQKIDLDEAIKRIMADPFCGESKKGDLQGVSVYKFNMSNQLTLIAYEFNAEEDLLMLLSIGSHENFYRDLKK